MKVEKKIVLVNSIQVQILTCKSVFLPHSLSHEDPQEYHAPSRGFQKDWPASRYKNHRYDGKIFQAVLNEENLFPEQVIQELLPLLNIHDGLSLDLEGLSS